jgi:hypothetical protein
MTVGSLVTFGLFLAGLPRFLTGFGVFTPPSYFVDHYPHFLYFFDFFFAVKFKNLFFSIINPAGMPAAVCPFYGQFIFANMNV